MSLVNDMLRDLQDRRGGSGPRPLAGLRAATQTLTATPVRIGSGWLWMLAPLLVVSAAMLWWSVREQPAIASTAVAADGLRFAAETFAAHRVAADPPAGEALPLPAPVLAAAASDPAIDPGRVAQLASLTRFTYSLDLRLSQPVVRAARPPVPAPGNPATAVSGAIAAATTAPPLAPTPGAAVNTKRPAKPSLSGLRDQGVSALRGSRAIEAETHFREMLRLYPDSTEGYLLVHAALTAQQRTAAAEAVLREGLSAAADGTRVALALARDLLARADNDAALAVLLQSRPAPHTDAVYEAFVAAVYQRAGRHADAAGVYRALLGNDVGNGAWWTGLGISEEAAGNRGAALEAFRHARRSHALESSLAGYVAQRIEALAGEGA